MELLNTILDSLSPLFETALAWDLIIPKESNARNVIKALSVFFAFMGDYFLLNAFMPETINTFKHKNVVGVNPMMFLLHFTVATFFSIGSIAMFIASIGAMMDGQDYATIDLPILGVIFTGCNIPSMIGCGYIVWLKRTSAKKAAALGISEAEYYREYTAKTVSQAV